MKSHWDRSTLLEWHKISSANSQLMPLTVPLLMPQLMKILMKLKLYNYRPQLKLRNILLQVVSK